MVASTLHLPSINYLAIAPEAILLIGAVLIVGASSVMRGGLRQITATTLTMLASAGALVAAIIEWHSVTTRGPISTIAGAIAMDGFSSFFAITIASALLLTTLIGHDYLVREGISTTEYHVLALASATGAVVMAQASDLMVLFVALEILSISLYVLAAFNPRRSESGEAALQYVLLGGFSSAVFVYGIALTYGATGSTNFHNISRYLAHVHLAHPGLLYAGLGLVLVGFAFKVAAVPFHLWTPDVYQGSPTPVTGFMASIAKVGAFAGLLRVLDVVFVQQMTVWQPIVYALAIASLVLGALVSLRQRNIKRMLAYSSINHTGFILLGVEAGTVRGLSASLFYLFTYAIMTVGTFGIVSLLGDKGHADHDLTRYRGLARRQPLLGGCLAVLLLAQAGIPFTTGFVAKFSVVLASIDAGSWPLALIAMITAGIAVSFYLHVVLLTLSPAPTDHDPTRGEDSGASDTTIRANRSVLLEDVETQVLTPIRVTLSPGATVAVTVATAVTIIFGVWPAPVLDFAAAAARSLIS